MHVEVEADAAAVKAAALAAVVSGTTMTGTLETQITATFPATVPAFFDTAGYVINSEISNCGRCRRCCNNYRQWSKPGIPKWSISRHIYIHRTCCSGHVNYGT